MSDLEIKTCGKCKYFGELLPNGTLNINDLWSECHWNPPTVTDESQEKLPRVCRNYRACQHFSVEDTLYLLVNKNRLVILDDNDPVIIYND